MQFRLAARLGGVVVILAAVLAGGGPAGAADSNIALGKATDATVGVLGINLLPAASCSAGSGPDNAVDGASSNIYTDKWCVPSGKPTLHIKIPANPRLGASDGWTISHIVIKHAGAGGEPASLNTRAYTLGVTQLKPGALYTQTCTRNDPLGELVCTVVCTATAPSPVRSDVVTVTNNSANVTDNAVSAKNVTDIWLTIDVPTQIANAATRIYEVEVYGSPSGSLRPAC